MRVLSRSSGFRALAKRPSPWPSPGVPGEGIEACVFRHTGKGTVAPAAIRPSILDDCDISCSSGLARGVEFLQSIWVPWASVLACPWHPDPDSNAPRFRGSLDCGAPSGCARSNLTDHFGKARFGRRSSPSCCRRILTASRHSPDSLILVIADLHNRCRKPFAFLGRARR